jgi:hypothetical protein
MEAPVEVDLASDTMYNLYGQESPTRPWDPAPGYRAAAAAPDGMLAAKWPTRSPVLTVSARHHDTYILLSPRVAIPDFQSNELRSSATLKSGNRLSSAVSNVVNWRRASGAPRQRCMPCPAMTQVINYRGISPEFPGTPRRYLAFPEAVNAFPP